MRSSSAEKRQILASGELLHHVAKSGRVEQRIGLGVVEDVVDLGHGQPRVDVHRGTAGKPCAQVCREAQRLVLDQQSDPGTHPQAAPREHVGQPATPVREFRICEAPACVGYRWQCGMASSRSHDQIANRLRNDQGQRLSSAALVASLVVADSFIRRSTGRPRQRRRPTWARGRPGLSEKAAWTLAATSSTARRPRWR